MKTKDKELDVDFIGGQGPLTVAEENALSEYFKKKKASIPAKGHRTSISKRKKLPA